MVLINRTGRTVERLAAAGRISADQLAWASELRDAWECAGLRRASLAQSWQRGSGGEPPIVRDVRAWQHYARAVMRLSGAARRAVIAVVIHDEAPAGYGGLAVLCRALERLGEILGYRAAHRAKAIVSY